MIGHHLSYFTKDNPTNCISRAQQGPQNNADVVFKQSDSCSAMNSHYRCHSAPREDKSLVPSYQSTSLPTCSAKPETAASSQVSLFRSNQQIAVTLPQTHISISICSAHPFVSTTAALLWSPRSLRGPCTQSPVFPNSSLTPSCSSSPIPPACSI